MSFFAIGVGGNVFTIVTSDGGRAVTLGESGVGTAVGDVTQFYQSATSAAGTLATGKSKYVVELNTAEVAC